MQGNYYSTRRNPSGLYRKAYRWAWSNLRSPKFTSADEKVFGLGMGWANASVLLGAVIGLSLAILFVNRFHTHIAFPVYFPIALCLYLLVGPAAQAGVIWSACMLKSIKQRKVPSA